MKIKMSRPRLRAVVLVVAQSLILAPGYAWACPNCVSVADSPMIRGMTWAVVALLGITGGVLCAFAVFFVYLFKRSRRMLGQEVSLHRSAQPGGGY